MREDGRAAPRAAAGRLVRRCLLDEAPPADQLAALLDRTSPASVEAAAGHHRVEGWVYERLRTVREAPAPLVARLKTARDGAAYHHLTGIWQLGEIGRALDEAGIAWVVVKGPVLVDALHGAAGRRTYEDLDVLVDPAAFASAIEALEAIGGRLLDRNWSLLRRQLRGQVHFELGGSMLLDLHWDLLNVYRRRMAIDTAELLGRRVEVDLGGLRVPTLDRADTLVHLAVHAATSGGDLYVWLKDLERAIAVWPPSWADVVERSRRWHVAGAVGIMLRRARQLLGTSVPDEVLRRLLGGAGSRVVPLVDRRGTFDRSLGGPTPEKFVARLAGHGLVDGAVVLGQRIVRHFDPREPDRSDPFAAHGGAQDRAAFLAAVATEAGPRR